MPRARKKTKTFKGAWLERATIDKLKSISENLGVNFTELLEKIADGEVIKATGDHVDANGEWETDGTKHWHTCSCGATFDEETHTGGTATCKDPAVCEVCGASHGDKNPANHTGGTEIRDDSPESCSQDGYSGDTYCLGCGEKMITLAASMVALAFLAPSALQGVRPLSFLPGLFALMLQGALWCAVGVAVSAMTTHAAASVTASLALLIALPRGLWAALLAWAPAGRPTFGAMPLDAHVLDIASGAVSTGTVALYAVLAFTALFIAAKVVSALRLVGRGAASLRFSTAFAVALSVVFAVLAILLAKRVEVTLDLPVGGAVTRFSPRMRNTLAESSGEISITCFLSRNDPRFRAIGHFLRSLKREADATGGARLELRFVDPRWDLGAAERLIRSGAKEESLVFEKSRRMVCLPLADGYGERVCASTIRRIAMPPQRRNVYWTGGHGESLFDDYGTFGMSDIARELALAGYRNDRIDLTGDTQIPSDCALILVSGAKEDFSRVEQGRIDAYLKRGGRLLALMAAEQGGVASLLPSWGLRPMSQPLTGVRTLSGSDVIVSDFTDHAVSSPLAGAQIVLERPLSFAPSAATESGFGADRLEYSSLAKAGSLAVAAAIERGAGAGSDLAIRPTRIVAVGDASFVMNGALAARANANRDFFLNCVAYLSGTDASSASGIGAGVFTTGMDRPGRIRFLVALAGAFPLAVFAVAAFAVFRRRRRG